MAMAMTSPKRGYHPPIEDLVWELQGDLPRLFSEHPKGISIHDLHVEYNDSTTRILRVLSILEEAGKVTVHKSANNSSFILPINAGPPDELGSLSDLQRSTCLLFKQLCIDNKTNKIRTNYAQLARLLSCSATGIRNCVDRLQHLGYVTILNPSSHGKQSELLLQVGDKLLTPKEPLD